MSSIFPPPELALLCRLCVLRRSAREEQLLDLFLCSPPISARVSRELTEALARLPHAGKHDDEFMESVASDVRAAIEAAHCAAPLAGPEATFRREVLEAAAQLLESQEEGLHVDLDDIAHLYAKAPDESPSEQFPLGAADRADLRTQYRQFNRLRDHPLLPFKEPDPVLSKAFDKLGWGKPLRGPAEDLGPADVFQQFLRVRSALRRITFKHVALRRVREVCRLRQEKWAVAGPLAALSAGELRQLLDSLVGRHLVLREADGSHTAHPAVRDHFARAGGPDRGRWHALLGQQLVSLVQRPGLRLPEDRASLDLVEEAIYHAAAAGASADALALYQEVLGGLRHLGWRLGEMARGLRILRGFHPCPDRWALGWFLRALGELEEACRHNDLPYFRADIRLLQGRLPEVENEGDEARSAMAAFLMGRSMAVPPPVLGCAVPRAQAWLYLGQLGQVEQAVNLAPLYHDLGWEGERARCVLLAAEAARRCGNTSECRRRLEDASGWVLHSGSVEHLCLFHAVRGRAAMDAGELEMAMCAMDEGLHIAKRCGFGLYYVDLLCARGQILLATGDAALAEQAGEEALARAAAADCRFAWGEAEAWHLLGRALARQGRTRSARAARKAARALWRRIGDPRA
jgi:tetratricopeptide (TPR) repeat protein